jgi:hypothetical protein
MAFGRWFINRFVPFAFPCLNPLILRILRSWLHRLLSWYVAIRHFEGGRSGRIFDVPFTYCGIDARIVECVTNRHAIWWRNLRGGKQGRCFSRGDGCLPAPRPTKTLGQS